MVVPRYGFPYTDPGLPLAKAIREGVQQHMQEEGLPPKLVLLQNHGIIALGDQRSRLAITLMAEKAAAIFVGAAALGGLSSCGPNTLIALLPGRMNTSSNSVCILGNPLQATEIPYE